MKNLGQLMKQAQEMQAKMGEMQERLAEMTVEGSSAAGMVTVTLSGKGEMKGIRIDPSLVNPAEADILEDLIVAAYNDAKVKVEGARAALGPACRTASDQATAIHAAARRGADGRGGGDTHLR